MFNFLENRLQKTLDKMKSKLTISEEDLTEITREIKLALLEADVNLVVVKEFVAKIKEKVLQSELIGKLNPSQQMVKFVKDELVLVLGGKTKPVTLDQSRTVIMMVGLQGSGKTTTCAKLARYFQGKKVVQKPLMIAADIYRPAAIEQLIILGKELQIEVFSLKGASPLAIVQEGLAHAKANGHDLIIIDTAGRVTVDDALMQEITGIQKLARPDETVLVVDAMSGQDIFNVGKAFNDATKISAIIIAKSDSDTRGGAALSLRQMLSVPIWFVGTGEKASALELFHPERMADRILGMGDVLTLIEQTEGIVDEKKANRMLMRMTKGEFNLDDLLDQLRQMKKMGKFSKIIKMMPGLSGKIDDLKIDDAEKRLHLYETIISSMTKAERKNPKLLKNPSRKARVMRGSGRSAQEFNQLVNDYERMHKQMASVAKSFKNGTFNPGKMT